MMARLLAIIAACSLFAVAGYAEAFYPRTASYDELISHMQRRGSTPERRNLQAAARTEIFQRGADALRHFVARSHIKNPVIQVTTMRLVEKLDPDESAPVLLSFLDSDHEKTRKYAAYYLGFHETPEHAQKLMPLFDDDVAAGATIRTMGKWHVVGAVPRIIPFLKDEKERRRIAAANALGEIGDSRAIPGLIEALADSYFTVRKSAARALTTIGSAAEQPLLDALPKSKGHARREIIAIFGQLKTRDAVKPLRVFLNAPSPGLRMDAARALITIDPERSERWITGTDAETTLLPNSNLINIQAFTIPRR